MIEGYRFGFMRVAGQDHGKDLIVFGPGVAGEEEKVEGDWWRLEGHSLSPSDLTSVKENAPEVLVIGPGAFGRMVVPEGTLAWLEKLEIETVVCATTKEAMKRYNELVKQGAKVAAAVHLTC
jgi:hypothetical protein